VVEILVMTVGFTSLCEGALKYCFGFLYDIAGSTNCEATQAVTQLNTEH
jgi:hypothetical protein